MSKVAEKERATQDRVIKLFEDVLGYTYLGNRKYRPLNRNIEDANLRRYLTRAGYNKTLRNRAVEKFKKTADANKDLYYVNKDVYSMLRYAVKVKEGVGEDTQDVWLINWNEPEKNDFSIAEEVSVCGENNKRPDLVIYINGIALGVIELKRSTVSVTEGIRQNLDNQQSYFIRSFFSTMQFVCAGNDTEGIRYGTIETPEKYYLKWKDIKEEDKNPHLLEITKDIRSLSDKQEHLLDKHIIQLFDKKRFIDLIYNFIVFDRGTKKICRQNQYFGVKAAQERVRRREGGIIWHTQGSGKSLIMVWLAKWIYENVDNARVLILTDRDELDKQIEKVFIGVDEDIFRTKSGKDLIDVLNSNEEWLMCSLIHKFKGKNEPEYDDYIEDLKTNLPSDFDPKGEMFIFVDECHRTQSGKLHNAMTEILPNAMLIGFTGTPLLKKDKETSIEVFGSYIHTYKYDEASKDKVVLELLYEARDVEQELLSPKRLDTWFDSKTKGLTNYAKSKLKKKWGTMKKVFSSKERLNKITNDIMFDMETRERLKNGCGNALLVSGSIYQACRYYELFQQAGLKQCAIVTSYDPSPASIKGESTGEGDTLNLMKYKTYRKMLGDKNVEDFEDEVKKKFINEPSQMKLLIVVDKLLTGFDAPSATYLYIDKKKSDHGLFQAICRVNRLDGEDKKYGYIIDYKDLFKSLEKAIKDYTSGAFEDYDKEDVKGLLKDRFDSDVKRLEEALEAIRGLCEPVEEKSTPYYIKYFCGDTENPEDIKDTEPRRTVLYKMSASLLRAYASIADDLHKKYSVTKIQSVKEEVKHYENVRQEIMLASEDYIDLKKYEPSMRHMIDSYIGAKEAKQLSCFDDLSLVELIVNKGVDAFDSLPDGIKGSKEAMAETIENNLRRVIKEEKPVNPKYYEKMSTLLDELIKKRKEQTIKYKEYLDCVAELTRKTKKPETGKKYPKEIKTEATRAFYDNLGKNKELAVELDDEILYSMEDGFRGNFHKERALQVAVSNVLEKYGKEDKLPEVWNLIVNQKEYE